MTASRTAESAAPAAMVDEHLRLRWLEKRVERTETVAASRSAEAVACTSGVLFGERSDATFERAAA